MTKTRRILKSCLKCKKRFHSYLSAKRKYCSVKCAGKLYAKIKKGCERSGCKNEYMVSPAFKNQKYCSYKCRGETQAKGKRVTNRKMTPDFARLIGHILGDGCIQIQKYRNGEYKCPKGYRIRYTNKEPELIKDFCETAKKIYPYARPSIHENKYREGVIQVDINGKNIVLELLPIIKDKKHVPNEILKGNKQVQAAFLAAFFDDEGSVTLLWCIDKKRGPSYNYWKRALTLVNNKKNIMKGIKVMFKTFGIKTNKLHSAISTRGGKSKPSKPYYYNSITELESYLNFKKQIPIKHPKKIKALNAIIDSYKTKPKIEQIRQFV